LHWSARGPYYARPRRRRPAGASRAKPGHLAVHGGLLPLLVPLLLAELRPHALRRDHRHVDALHARDARRRRAGLVPQPLLRNLAQPSDALEPRCRARPRGAENGGTALVRALVGC